MDVKVKKSCPNCNQFYTFQPKSNQVKWNIPLFLSCGHSMCETCVTSVINFGEPLECKICHHEMEISTTDLSVVSQNKVKLYKLFPVNMFMLGELAMEAIENTKEKKDKNEECFINLQAILKSADNMWGQCVECHNSTKKMCQQCETILCDTCFNKTHKNFIVFKNHSLQNIEATINVSKCKLHKKKSLDYYCKDCMKSVCMDCLMLGNEKSCKNHNIESTQEVNEEFLEVLNDISPKVDETLRRLTKTAVDVGNLLHEIQNDSRSSSDLTQMVDTVEQHFSKLFAVIQKRKQDIIDIILQLKSAERNSLQKAKNDIENAIKKTKLVLNTINLTSDPNIAKQMNLAVLLEEAKQIIDLPWYLKHNEVKQDPLKVTVNEDLYTLVNEYVHLEGNPCSTYKIYSTTELGEDIEIPPPPSSLVFPPELPHDVRQTSQSKAEKNKKAPMFYREAPKYRSKADSTSSLNSLDSDSSHANDMSQKSVVQQTLAFEESQHPKELLVGSNELIYISHIVNPHDFYVQRACHQDLVKEMLREFRNSISLHKPTAHNIAEGKIYLVYNKADNVWQRCRVVSIDRENINKPMLHVFCIDFGSTEVVSINKLRLIPLVWQKSPHPLAIHCSLANCEPKMGTWTSEDSFLIQKIVNNKQAVIHIRQILSTSNYSVKYDCDVTTFENGVNLAHALVFHDRARLLNSQLTYPKVISHKQKPKLFLGSNDFTLNGIEEVYITHVLSPDKFYVRKRHFQNTFEKLCEDLEKEYSSNDSDLVVYLPDIGMACAVNTEKYWSQVEIEGIHHNPWQRCVVQELPSRARVRVFLPDCGATLIVHYSALRYLHNQFTTTRALATECHLAGVTPLNKKWSTGSVKLLQKFIDRLLELRVEDNRSRESMGVILYDKSDEENVICINMEMIKHKFAVTFGIYTFNKNSTIDDQVYTNKSPLEEKTCPKPNKPKTKKIKILNKDQSPKKIKETDLEAKDKGPIRLEAKVLHYQSPSLLYVSLVHQQKAFSDLFEKMQIYYTKRKTSAKEDWKVGDRCCTLCKQSQTWRRAVILEIEEKNAKVFFSDFACVETIPISSLRELTSEFASIGDASIKCHLYGVVPADGEEWPSLTKEYLKELLDAYKRIFITKLGNFKNKSMPVEVWVYHTIQGDALEPNKSEWRCLNKKIIEQGLGIPDKSQECDTSEDNADNYVDEMLSYLNITESVNELLQLKSLPANSPVTKSSSESTSVDCEEADLQSVTMESSNTVFISDWLPPEPLQSQEFTAMPTYVDNYGFIYLHDISQQDTLDLIKKALDQRFKDPEPKAKYTKWTIGEPCIAKYFLDNRFYRGKVLEVDNDASTCLIQYVDYGNEEVCSFSNLRKNIVLHQIPIQAYKCVLSRIRPKGDKWDRETLDYIHRFIVEKKCYVKVVGEPINDIIPIDLRYDKLWINDHLVDFEMALYTDGSKAIIRKYTPIAGKNKQIDESITIESDSGPDYIVEEESAELSTSFDSSGTKSSGYKVWKKIIEDVNDKDEDLKDDEKHLIAEENFITYPKNNDDDFQCNITVINDTNTLELNIIHNDETNLLYEQLFEKIKTEGGKMLPLNGIFENKACIALFREDNQWYRATILQYCETTNRVKVRYIDYGNVEIVSLSDLREINEEWAKMPPANVTVWLYGVKINPDMDINIITKEYTDVFLDKGPFYAKIIKYDNSLPNVELRNEKGDLVYDKLIENGLFLPIECPDWTE